MDINVLISNPDFFADLLSLDRVDGIYVEEERITPARYKEMVKKAHANGKRMYLALPYVWNTDVQKSLDRNLSAYSVAEGDGYLVRNLDELGILMAKNAEGPKILDANMYTWNTSAMNELRSIGADAFTAPYELNKGELAARGLKDTEVVIYGHYPMMVSNNCLKLTKGHCVKDPKSAVHGKDAYSIYMLKDRTGAEFPVVNRCRYCYNVIYNSVPTWLMDETQVYGGYAVRLNFTTETRMQMLTVLENYFKGNDKPQGKITRGHYKRGAE